MKKIKRTKRNTKILSVLLTAILVFSTVMPTFSADLDNMQKILLSVKERIGDTDEFESFESNSDERNGEILYTFYWAKNKSNSEKNISVTATDDENISVTATDDGIITKYYSYDGKDRYKEKPNFNQISVDEAAARTKLLIDALNPKISNEIVVISEGTTQSLYLNGFTFFLQRYVNGIKVYNNTGNVRVNSDATEIQSFNLNYDEDIRFPDAAAVISKEEAQKAYGEKIGMTLEYRENYDYKTKTRTVIPVYIPVNSEEYINALDGGTEKFTYAERFNSYYSNSLSSGGGKKEEAATDSLKMSEAETLEFEKLDGLKSKDELVKIAKNNSYIAITEDMELINYSTSRAYNEELYTATVSFEKAYEDRYAYTSVDLNMKTGEILSFYKNKEADSLEKKAISEEKIRKIKDKATADLAGEKSSEYKYDENEKRYIRYINGIPFKSDRINIKVSESDGEIISYNISYSNLKFPSLSGVITKDEAVSHMFSQIDYEYVYAKTDYKAEEAKIIYMLDENISASVDAFTGKLTDYSNEEYVSEKFNGYTDISGHYAENIVNTLAKFGIYFEGNELKPGEAVTQKEFIALLVSVFKRSGSIVLKSGKDYADEYSSAIRNNIIMTEEENPDEAVTREFAVKYTIRAMGIEKIAEIPDIYVCPFADVKNLKGHIAILYGLGIINGDGSGSFYPNNVLTRADALVMIYNYLAE